MAFGDQGCGRAGARPLLNGGDGTGTLRREPFLQVGGRRLDLVHEGQDLDLLAFRPGLNRSSSDRRPISISGQMIYTGDGESHPP